VSDRNQPHRPPDRSAREPAFRPHRRIPRRPDRLQHVPARRRRHRRARDEHRTSAAASDASEEPQVLIAEAA
jgi:hypothetical protein